ncbi:MurR/RpiR family transcriptional regulator [Collinsella sp.]|uniref:MurR/RpiR family transcriptional regulator n=1 Tax=Collinsella sp. TaxID=1965294 RepID=UPI003FED8FA0
MASLLVRLKQHKDSASPAERDLIGRILEAPGEISGLSIHELAAYTFASPSTITRMCKKLGLKGSQAFQRFHIYDLALLRENELSKIDDLAPTDTTRQTIEKVTRGNVDSLRLVGKLNDPEVYDTCVDLMEAARTINLFGMGASLLSARDLHYKLLRIGVNCNLIDDWHGQLLYASNSGPDDLSIAISYSGSTDEVNTCARLAHERGGKVIAITGAGFESELTRSADQILFVGSTEPLMRSAAMASRIGQLGVIDILFKSFVNRNYERFSEVLEKNQIRKHQ